MKLIVYTIRRILRWLRAYSNAYLVYSRLGVETPFGSIIEKTEGIEIGKSFTLGVGVKLYCHDPENGSRIFIGNNVALNDDVTINADCGGEIVLGDNVIIGPNAILRASNHSFDKLDAPIREQGHESGKIVLENNVWIGAGVIVLPNVIIGHGSVVGAGSVVTGDIAPESVAVGVPAKVIRNRRDHVNSYDN